jgi:hypothetical protein
MEKKKIYEYFCPITGKETFSSDVRRDNSDL